MRSNSFLSESMPGPGQYPILTKIGKDGPKNSMHATLNYFPNMKENKQKPGPGTYGHDNQANDIKNNGQWRFASDPRFKNKSFDVMKSFQQNPGAYDPKFQTCKLTTEKMWTFGTGD